MMTHANGATPQADVRIDREGSIFLFTPLTDAAREFIKEHVQADAQWWAGSLVVEHRYARDLARGMANDGLRLE